MVTLDDIIEDIHGLEAELVMLEKQYGLHSAGFYHLYQAGKLEQDRDFIRWVGYYETKLERETRYRKNARHNRVLAPGISFEQANLPFLIQEIEALIRDSSESPPLNCAAVQRPPETQRYQGQRDDSRLTVKSSEGTTRPGRLLTRRYDRAIAKCARHGAVGDWLEQRRFPVWQQKPPAGSDNPDRGPTKGGNVGYLYLTGAASGMRSCRV